MLEPPKHSLQSFVPVLVRVFLEFLGVFGAFVGRAGAKGEKKAPSVQTNLVPGESRGKKNHEKKSAKLY